MLFYEYFHGDDGRGIGASHQTGWTGCIARLIQGRALPTRERLLKVHAADAVIQVVAGAATRGPRPRRRGGVDPR